MTNLIIVHGPQPDIFEVAFLIFTTFVFLWLLNTIYQWLKNKPWRKKDVQIPTLSNNNSHIS